jgi:hypothetical protein
MMRSDSNTESSKIIMNHRIIGILEIILGIIGSPEKAGRLGVPFNT